MAKVGDPVVVKEYDNYTDSEVTSLGFVSGVPTQDDYPNDTEGFQRAKDAGIVVVTVFRKDGSTATYPIRGTDNGDFVVGTYSTNSSDFPNTSGNTGPEYSETEPTPVASSSVGNVPTTATGTPDTVNASQGGSAADTAAAASAANPTA
jgi:hypothetical protein